MCYDGEVSRSVVHYEQKVTGTLIAYVVKVILDDIVYVCESKAKYFVHERMCLLW